MKTRHAKLQGKIAALQSQLHEMKRERERCQEQLDKYVKRHRSLSYDKLETGDIERLTKIYAYFDERYSVQWQGGLRCDNRGMHLCFWVDDDPEYLNLHLTSTSKNICFGGSTSWLVKAETLEDKIAALTQIKKDIKEVLK